MLPRKLFEALSGGAIGGGTEGRGGGASNGGGGGAIGGGTGTVLVVLGMPPIGPIPNGSDVVAGTPKPTLLLPPIGPIPKSGISIVVADDEVRSTALLYSKVMFVTLGGGGGAN